MFLDTSGMGEVVMEVTLRKPLVISYTPFAVESNEIVTCSVDALHKPFKIRVHPPSGVSVVSEFTTRTVNMREGVKVGCCLKWTPTFQDVNLPVAHAAAPPPIGFGEAVAGAAAYRVSGRVSTSGATESNSGGSRQTNARSVLQAPIRQHEPQPLLSNEAQLFQQFTIWKQTRGNGAPPALPTPEYQAGSPTASTPGLASASVGAMTMLAEESGNFENPEQPLQQGEEEPHGGAEP